jgi:nickel/cobalt transporter (NicO) family protein
MPPPSAPDSIAWALALGLGLGLRHATDVDHVASVSTLLRGEPGTWRAARLAALWGAGHSFSFGAVGLLLVLAGIRLPRAVEGAAELLVALMLIGLGALRILRRTQCGNDDARAGVPRLRPAFIGFVHGLAGSAAIALLVGSSIRSARVACLYLLVFGLGTTLGMVALTSLLSLFIQWSGRRTRVGRWVELATAWLSIVLGVAILVPMAR